MSDEFGALAGAGDPRRRHEELPLVRRVGSWLVWWTLLMSLWVWLDDSLGLAELLTGAGAAAIGASVAELVQYQAATHFRMRIEWVVPALRLPGRLLRDLVLILRVLVRRIVAGEQPPSAFRAIPVDPGDDTPEGITRRVLLTAGRSFTPNTFVLGIDRERGLMVVHDLVPPSSMQRA